MATHSCVRSTAQNASYGYSEGCEHVDRLCPACRQFKPQAGWWWGMRWGTVTWVCADCRLEPLDSVAATKYQAIAESHPAYNDVPAGFERFAAVLAEDISDEDRYSVAQALDRSAQMQTSEATGRSLRRISAAFREKDFDGEIDIDASDLDLPARRNVTVALYSAANSPHISHNIAPFLGRLMRAWEAWEEKQVREPKMLPTDTQRKELDLAAVRRNQERSRNGHH